MECIISGSVMTLIFIEEPLRRRVMSSSLANLHYLVSSVHSHTEEAVLEANQWDVHICSGKVAHVDQINQGLLFIFCLRLSWTR